MDHTESDGWVESAQAWIDSVGETGDYGRKFVLDAPMLARVRAGAFRHALDVGCGEGRFCRMLRDLGVETVGIDPVESLIARARSLDPQGDYRIGKAEVSGVACASFDLVVSYLTLIDMPDLAAGVDGMIDALRPGGTLLVANLTSFNTAGMPDGWTYAGGGRRAFRIDHYLEERAVWVSWKGIRIQNWHRPLSTYMTLFLERGMQLTHFAEPEPIGGDPGAAEHYRRVPFFHIMEWRKPAS